MGETMPHRLGEADRAYGTPGAKEQPREAPLELVGARGLSVGAFSLAKEERDRNRWFEHQNEDAALADQNLGVYGVFDGIGGAEKGEEASRLASEEVARVAAMGPDYLRVFEGLAGTEKATEELTILKEFVARELKLSPWEIAGEQEVEGMVINGLMAAQKKVAAWATKEAQNAGTTASVFAFYRSPAGRLTAKIGNVGDSRIYRLRQGRLEQVTQDDSLYNALVKMGSLTGKEEEDDPLPEGVRKRLSGQKKIRDIRNIIVQALGQAEDPGVHIQNVPAQEDDLFIAVSDGISDNLTDAQMQERLGKLQDKNPGAIAAAIAEYARQISRSGGPRAKPDDMTAVVVRADKEIPLETRLKAWKDRRTINLSDSYGGLAKELHSLYALRNQVEIAMRGPERNPKLQMIAHALTELMAEIDARQRRASKRTRSAQEAPTVA